MKYRADLWLPAVRCLRKRIMVMSFLWWLKIEYFNDKFV